MNEQEKIEDLKALFNVIKNFINMLEIHLEDEDEIIKKRTFLISENIIMFFDTFLDSTKSYIESGMAGMDSHNLQ